MARIITICRDVSGLLGTIVMAAAGVSPSDANSNLAAWLELKDYSALAWFAQAAAGYTLLIVGTILIVVWSVSSWLTRETTERKMSTVKNCIASENGGDGFHFGPGSRIDEIDGNIAENNGGRGFSMHGRAEKFTNNISRNNGNRLGATVPISEINDKIANEIIGKIGAADLVRVMSYGSTCDQSTVIERLLNMLRHYGYKAKYIGHVEQSEPALEQVSVSRAGDVVNLKINL